MGNYHPWVRGISAMSPGAALVAGWLIEPQPTSNYSVGLWFPHTAGGIEPGDWHLPPRFIRVVDMWTAFLTSGWERILPVNGGTSTLDRAATLAARWLPGPQLFRDHLVGVSFSNSTWRYRLGGSALTVSAG